MSIGTTTRRVVNLAYRRYRGSSLQWHIDNARAELRYRLGHGPVTAVARDVVDTLDRDGIAIVNVDRVVDHDTTEKLFAEIANRQAASAPSASGTHYKSRYRHTLLGESPCWEPDSAFARFASSPDLKSIVDAYYGLDAKLRYYNVWHTYPVENPPSDSQLWHRDQDDRFILKVFLYLSDVTADAGPLHYIAGSHAKGRLVVRPKSFRENGHGNPRTTDGEMQAVVPEAQWIRAVGGRGTLVFVDTAGFHKGGYSRTMERQVYTCMFTSPAARDSDMFDRPRSQ